MPEKAESDKSKEPEKSRLKRLKLENGDDYEPAMPPIECGEHLLNYLWSVGPTMSGGMGECPVSQSELHAYQLNTGIELSAWEAGTIRRLSIEHLNQSHLATKRDCVAPWSGEKIRALKEVDTRNALRALAAL